MRTWHDIGGLTKKTEKKYRRGENIKMSWHKKNGAIDS